MKRPPAKKSPIDTLLGTAEPMCKTISESVSVHWFKGPAKPGDFCLCGKTRKKKRS